ncbi:hypothetical protein [Lutispora thermophila]|uniref:Acetyltransferase (GNAT) domain-containing protein n=1 Tax=Lutispora thermophila DSM 19022 TaxID=1122184 RepID=A0A1M6H0B4_9FIRM|nr:hypothetical protein [Lutispora thermophila]SHJ15699.1 hypothetical protein SAMN02745176_02587 [Lutispora thermophila DSM 19022]
MNKVIIKEDVIPEIDQLAVLYNDAGWYTYTNDVIKLKNAVQNSLKVITSWDNEKLVGLIRVVGDVFFSSFIYKIF